MENLSLAPAKMYECYDDTPEFLALLDSLSMKELVKSFGVMEWLSQDEVNCFLSYCAKDDVVVSYLHDAIWVINHRKNYIMLIRRLGGWSGVLYGEQIQQLGCDWVLSELLKEADI